MAITGAFKTTPTAALEWLLNLTPLHIVVETETRKALHRLGRTGLWNTSMPGLEHTKLAPTKELDDIRDMNSDTTLTTYMFNKRFSTHIPTRDQWRTGLKKQSKKELIWYTDGSKTRSGTGAGVYTEGYCLSQSMGALATIYQAETYAISVCAKEILDRQVTDSNIYICSDSQAALKAISSYELNSALTVECAYLLNRCGARNTVRLVWVPGHTGVEGNERADDLARKGATRKFVGPEPFIGIPDGAYRGVLYKYAKEQHKKEWEANTKLRHSKQFIGMWSESEGRRLLRHGRTQLRQLIGAYTGHYGTKEHLHKMNLSGDVVCRHCETEAETMKHVLCSCDALARRRMNCLGVAYPTPEEYRLFPPAGIYNLVQGVFGSPGT